jgi:hypothetical protein
LHEKKYLKKNHEAQFSSNQISNDKIEKTIITKKKKLTSTRVNMLNPPIASPENREIKKSRKPNMIFFVKCISLVPYMLFQTQPHVTEGKHWNCKHSNID